MKTPFRRLQPAEDKAGHQVWIEAFDWLQTRGIRQWLVPLPIEAFRKRTRDGRNYGLFDGENLLAVVALGELVDDHWTDALGPGPHWWLGALAIRSTLHGRKIGKRVIAHACTEAAAAGATELYLDCVEGALLRYYSLLGFTQREAKTITYPSGNSFSMVLMTTKLPNQAFARTAPAS